MTLTVAGQGESHSRARRQRRFAARAATGPVAAFTNGAGSAFAIPRCRSDYYGAATTQLYWLERCGPGRYGDCRPTAARVNDVKVRACGE